MSTAEFDATPAPLTASGGDSSPDPASSAAAGTVGLPVGGADLALLGALADGAGRLVAGDVKLDMQSYDGHVALALDPGLLPDMDSTLDALTSTHELFDVPVLDVSLDDSIAT